jgi:hypothetical protein
MQDIYHITITMPLATRIVPPPNKTFITSIDRIHRYALRSHSHLFLRSSRRENGGPVENVRDVVVLEVVHYDQDQEDASVEL